MSIALPSRKLLLLEGTGAGFPFPGASLDMDFVNNAYFTAASGTVTLSSVMTLTRATAETVTDASGVLSFVTSGNFARSNAGLQVWETRANVARQSSDLTNAQWVISNSTDITAAKDQIGPDGVTNSASSILCNVGNGTILNTCVIGSSARFQSAYVKRLIGSGVVNMTMDNGSTWTAIPVTSAWTRVSIPTQTLANPVCGFQMVSSGDKIAVYGVQNENGLFVSPLIPTTAAAGTRNADVIVLAGDALTAIEGTTVTAIIKYVQNPSFNSQTTTTPRSYHLAFSDAGNSRWNIRASDTSSAPSLILGSGTGVVVVCDPTFSGSAGSTLKLAARWSSASPSAGQCVNGLTENDNATQFAGGITTMNFGSSSAGAAQSNMNYLRFTLVPRALPVQPTSALP